MFSNREDTVLEDFKRSETVKYNSKVRVGNWFEENCLEKDEIHTFLEKRNSGELLLQKIRKLKTNLLRQIKVDHSKDNINFGSIVQLSACDLKYNKNNEQKSTLSVSVDENYILQRQHINEKCPVTVGFSSGCCIRNTFVIKSVGGNHKDNEPLKYGQDFFLQCFETDTKDPLLLCSSAKSADLSSAVGGTFSVRVNGEINLKVGLCKKFDIVKTPYEKPKIPTGDCRWMCQHFDPEKRFESFGKPVPVNQKIVITHCATNRNLAVEPVLVDTFFGTEFMISVHTYLDVYKRETWQNMWSITAGIALQ